MEKEKEQLIEDLKPYDEGEHHLREVRRIPFLFGEDDRFVHSPIQDDFACLVTRREALGLEEFARQLLDREAMPLVKAQTTYGALEMRPHIDRMAKNHSLSG